MIAILTDAQFQLLVVLCGVAGDYQLALVENLLNRGLSSHETDELIDVIFKEFLMSGIEENFEPNTYGLELEALLDAVNRMRLKDNL
jgi:hypothetical protein